MGAAGREYVQREFTWPLIIDRYRAFLERVGALTIDVTAPALTPPRRRTRGRSW